MVSSPPQSSDTGRDKQFGLPPTDSAGGGALVLYEGEGGGGEGGEVTGVLHGG